MQTVTHFEIAFGHIDAITFSVKQQALGTCYEVLYFDKHEAMLSMPQAIKLMLIGLYVYISLING